MGRSLIDHIFDSNILFSKVDIITNEDTLTQNVKMLSDIHNKPLHGKPYTHRSHSLDLIKITQLFISSDSKS